MKNKVIVLIGIFIIITGTIFGMTISYFISKDKVDNYIKIGEIATEIIEKDEKGDEYNKDKDVKKGEEIVKKVTIKNPSKNKSLVRVSITARLVDPSDTKKILEMPSNLIKFIFVNNYENNWYKDSKTNYFYYNKILKGEEESECLLEKVKLSDDISDELKHMELKIDIKAEAVEARKINDNSRVIYKYEEVWTNINNKILNKKLRLLVDNDYL